MENKKNYLFVHIPKNAGNSIMKLFEEEKVPLAIKRHYPNCYEDGTIKMFLLGITGYGCWQNFYSFAFTRNPYERVKSAYKYLMKGGLQALDKKYQGILMSYGSFKECCKHLHILKKTMVHFVSQSDFLCDCNDKILPNFVGKCENFEEDLRKVAPFIKRTIKINCSSDCCDDLELTDEIKQYIYEAYEKDFIIFGYEK